MAKKLSEMSNEELLKWQKTVKAIVYMMFGFVAVLAVLVTILFVKQGFSPISILPVAMLPVAMLNVYNLSNIKKEVTARGI